MQLTLFTQIVCTPITWGKKNLFPCLFCTAPGTMVLVEAGDWEHRIWETGESRTVLFNNSNLRLHCLELMIKLYLGSHPCCLQTLPW